MNATTALSKSGLPALDDMRTEKLHAWHRERLAGVYVRQSTVQQVLDHQESTRLQYGLLSRAQVLGWAADRILVIDDPPEICRAGHTGRAGTLSGPSPDPPGRSCAPGAWQRGTHLATDIPVLWAAPTITDADRKGIIRQIGETGRSGHTREQRAGQGTYRVDWRRSH